MGDCGIGVKAVNIAEFFFMGGYGKFVWSAIGLTLILIMIEIITVRSQYKKVVQRIRRIQQIREVDTSGDQS